MTEIQAGRGKNAGMKPTDGEMEKQTDTDKYARLSDELIVSDFGTNYDTANEREHRKRHLTEGGHVTRPAHVTRRDHVFHVDHMTRPVRRCRSLECWNVYRYMPRAHSSVPVKDPTRKNGATD